MRQRGVLIRAPGGLESRPKSPGRRVRKGRQSRRGSPSRERTGLPCSGALRTSVARPFRGADGGCPAGAGVGGGEGAQEVRAAGIRRVPAL